MKLFGLKDSRGQLVPNIYFADKFKAKTARNDMAKETGEQFFVTFGPDHHRFNKGNQK